MQWMPRWPLRTGADACRLSEGACVAISWRLQSISGWSNIAILDVPAATGLAFRRGLRTFPSSPELAPDRRLGLSGGGPVTAIRTQLLASTWPLRPDDTACAA
jgi:hypothetical protein